MPRFNDPAEHLAETEKLDFPEPSTDCLPEDLQGVLPWHKRTSPDERSSFRT